MATGNRFFWIPLMMIFQPLMTGSCQNSMKPSVHATTPEQVNLVSKMDYDTIHWTEITEAKGYFLDIRYSTKNNFTGDIIYPCGRFFLRPAVAAALDKVRMKLEIQGYKLLLFDGYRPKSAQLRLWEKVPNPDYVAPPSEGSMHNRGVAIDLTLTDEKGKELDLGTPYDFFGSEAHIDYVKHSKEVLDLRQLLRSAMQAEGFQPIRTEWWHFSYTKGSYPLDDWNWECPD